MRRPPLAPALVLAACAASGPGPPASSPPPPLAAPAPLPAAAPDARAPGPAAAPTRPACTAFARPGVLRRSAVVRAVDGGLGRWLRGVDVRPGKARGRFRGWLLRSLHPDDPCFLQIDLRPGDVVLKVNGRSVERPEEANEVFVGLRTAPSLVVEYDRGGKPATLTLPIADE